MNIRIKWIYFILVSLFGTVDLYFIVKKINKQSLKLIIDFVNLKYS